MKRVTYPCKECADRYVGCHSKCEKYIEAKRRSMKRLATRDRDKIIDDTLYNLKYNRVRSLKQGHK